MTKRTKIILIIIAAVTAFYIAMSYLDTTKTNNISFIDEMLPYANGQEYESVGLKIISDNKNIELELICNKEKKHMNAQANLYTYPEQTPVFENEIKVNDVAFRQIEQKVEYEITGDTLIDNAGLHNQVTKRKTLTDAEPFLNVLVANANKTVPIRVNGINDTITLVHDDINDYLRTIEYSCKG